MNMFSTGNREEDELLRLLRQGLITPEQLEDMSAGQQGARELRGSASDSLSPMGSRRDDAVRAAASLQPETIAMAQAPAQRASTPMASRSEGMMERGLEDLLKDRASTAAPMVDQRREEEGQPRFVNTFAPRGYLPEEKAELSIRERARGKQDPNISLDATPIERGLLPGERAEEEAPDESFDPSLGRYPEMPIVMEETIVTPNDGDAEEDQRGLLSRIGGLIANNPELAASGAQLLGGLISNAAQNRAQRRADRTTDQRVARANLISAITGGRARPTVERAQADTGGFLSLDTLGKAFQGGGAAYKSELARQVEEGERERRADLDERQMALREGQAESLAAYRAARAAEGSSPPKIPAGIEKTIKQFDGSIKVIDQFLGQLENYDKEDEKDTTDTFQRAYQGLATRIPVLGSLVNPKAQQYTDQRSMLVGEVAKIINGGSGQVSNFDLELAENVVPDIRNPRDTGEFGIEKLNNLRKILDLRRSAFAEGYSESIYEDAASLVRGEEEGDDGAAEVTAESITVDQRLLLQRAREGDEEAVRQVRELGLI
jgi:hypothetical protein